jgi:ketosteroid isomerase-like protein
MPEKNNCQPISEAHAIGIGIGDHQHHWEKTQAGMGRFYSVSYLIELIVNATRMRYSRTAMSPPFPEADAATAAQVRDWLDRFASCVREVDYAAARPFWHPEVVIFGTYQELVKSLSAWTERQWDNVWPRTAEFRFDLDNTVILAAPGGAMAVAVAPWNSTGFQEDGTPFERPGRTTIVLMRQPDGHWLGVHSHMSLARGVPQDSHGKRTVKAR